MVDLVVGNSYVEVYGKDAFYPLYEGLASTNPNAYWMNKKRSKWAPEVDSKWRLFDNHRHRFPKGLLTRASGLLVDAGVQFQILSSVEYVEPPEPVWYGGGLVPRDYQVKAVEKYFEQEFGIVSIPTRGGKTPVGLMAASRFMRHYPCLYLVTKIEAQDDVLESCAKWFDGVDMYRGVSEDVGLSVSTYQTAANRDLTHFKFVVGDEIHRAGAETFFDALVRCDSAWYRMGLSGTPGGRSDGKDIYFEAASGPVCFQMERQVLIDRGLCAHGKVLRVHVPGAVELDIESYKKSGHVNWLELERVGIVEYEERDLALTRAMMAAREGDDQVLVMVQKKVHGERFARLLTEQLGFEVPFLSSKTPTKKRRELYEKLKTGKLSAAVASPIFDDSVTLPHVKILINAAGGKSPIATSQRLGRALGGDKSVVIIDADDSHHHTLRKHSQWRFKTYEREGYECQNTS